MSHDGIQIVRIPYSHYEVRGNSQVWVLYAESRANWTVYDQNDRTQSYYGVRGYRAAVNLALAKIRGEKKDDA
jgi:3-phenylpropionate/cinnamic acid dioxygenase small subunit